MSRWEGEPGSVAEMGVVASGPRAGETVVRIDPKYFRPAEARPHGSGFRIAGMSLDAGEWRASACLQGPSHARQVLA